MAGQFFLFRDHIDGRLDRTAFQTGLLSSISLFIAWAVLVAHYPLLVILGFLFFLAFAEDTRRHQVVTSLRGPLLVGFFSACPRNPWSPPRMVDRTGAAQFVRMAIDDWCDATHGSE